MVTRRELLKLSLGAALLSRSRGSHASRRASFKTRYFVTVVLGGGIDAIMSTDPKSRAQVETWVDVPYNANEIVTRGRTPLGPLLAPLVQMKSPLRAAILNGVLVATASHPAGLLHLARLKSGADRTEPTIHDVLSAHREGQPVGTISFGGLTPPEYSPGWFGNADGPGGILQRLDVIDPTDLRRMASALRKSARRLTERRDPQETRTANNILESAGLFERLVEIPRYREERWSDDEEAQSIASTLQRTLWLLEHDLVKCVRWDAGQRWDSHSNNLVEQTRSSKPFFEMFARFLGELAQRRGHFGALSEQTSILIGSELGRFPRLNTSSGKDHFPEAPYILFGPDFNTRGAEVATYGGTGRKMEALPISLRTGAVDLQGHPLRLDDLGTTLLHLAGIDPRRYGYEGQILDFVIA
jgi:hypothetical protein